MAEQEKVNAQGEINASVANRLANLEQQLSDTEEALEALNKAANHLATLLEAQYNWKNRIEALEKQVEKLENDLKALEDQVDYKANDEHYHDEYANVDHVERSENSFNSQIHSIENDISNLEYRVDDAESKIRQTRSGW